MSITVFTKAGCIQCNATIQRFEKSGKEVNVVDIEKDEAGFSKVNELGYRGLPVVMVGETHWSGFQPDMIKQACA